MALSDPDKKASLLADMHFWLPSGNTLDDQDLSKIIDYTIAIAGDDDSQYAEVLCKSLKNAALKNHAEYQVDTAPIVSEKVGEVQTRWSEEGNQKIWKNYIKSLESDICPIFGYTPPSKGIGMKIHPSEPINVNSCCNSEDDLYL